MLGKFAALALLVAHPGLAEDSRVVPAQSEGNVTDSGQSLLLFAVQIDNVTLTETLTAYGDPGDPLIPLGELSRLLDLPLAVNPRTGVATGRLGENQRPLTIDLAAGSALLAGQVITLAGSDSMVTPVDIFLRASLVQKLLPILIKSDPNELVLTLIATEKLPLQANRERAARLAQIGGTTEPTEDVLQVTSPYRWLGRPAFDFGVEVGVDSARSRPTTRFEARVAADVLQTSFTGYVASNDSGDLSAARLRAERRSPEGNLFGPLNATYAAAGDVYTPGLSLGPRSAGGVGFVFSTAKIEDASVFERINLRGDLPIGYDAELYVNDVLRSGQSGAVAPGRYDFTDVPLVRGRNIIRVVLYGPRGERSEQTRVINVGGGQLAAGMTVIDGGVVAQDRPVLDLSDDASLTSDMARGRMRATLSVAHGVTARLTASVGLGLFTDQSGRSHQVLTGGLRSSLLGMAVQADYAKDLKGGSGTSIGAAGRIGGISFLARHVEYGGNFCDEANVTYDVARPIERYSELIFDAGLPLPGQVRLPVSGRVQRAVYADGGVRLVGQGRTTLSVADTLMAFGADYSRNTHKGETTERLTGSVAASRFIDYKWQLRASADYDVKPKFSVRALSVTVDRALNDRYSLRLGATQTLGNGHDTSLQASVSARLPYADATLAGDYSTSQRRWRVGLQLSFGLAFDPVRESYRATPPGPGNGASAVLLAFIDSNANGRQDAGEAPVPGLVLQGAGRPITTDAQGHAFVTGLGDGPSGMLRLDTSKTDTVFVSSPPPNIGFTPRSGDVLKILYAMVPTSEVVIRLRFRQPEGAMSGLSAVRVRLVGGTGADSPSISTEFDGTAVFDEVEPGNYRVELDAEQAGRLGMRLAAPIAVKVAADGNSVMREGEIVFSRDSGE